MITIGSIVDYAKNFIEQCIVTGELSPGQRIKEEEIAKKLEISRPPVREAFKILEAEGLIRRNPRRGVFVTEITSKDVWEIYTLKMVYCAPFFKTFFMVQKCRVFHAAFLKFSS